MVARLKKSEAPTPITEDLLGEKDPMDNPLERELASVARIAHKQPGHPEINMLTAKEEAARRKRSSRAKKYDGRARSKNNQTKLPRVREALESFYQEVQLPDLKQALEISNDPRYNMLLAALNNPRFASTSFAELCRKCKMSLQDVVEVWRNHIKTRGIVKMMSHMPDIMEDVAIDSKSRVVKCDMCQGKGRIADRVVNKMKNATCPECHGDGVVRINGDKDARNLAFETVGLRKAGGVSQQVNVQVNSGGVPSLEDQMASADKIFDIEYTSEGASNGPNGRESNDRENEKNAEPAGSDGGTAAQVAQLPPASTSEPAAKDDYSWAEPPETSDPTDYSS